MILPFEGDEASGRKPGTPTVFLSTRFEERMPEFSPDGRWLAYASNESGRYEVYVRPFPGPGSTLPVSVGGSSTTFAASWSRTRQELLYESPDGQIMVVPYTTANASFVAGKPRPGPGARISFALDGEVSSCTRMASAWQSRPFRSSPGQTGQDRGRPQLL
jgi:hypothetical protein